MQPMLTVTASPHIRSAVSTPRIMLDVILALLPTSVAGVILFGWRALAVLCASVLSAVLAEFVFNLITRRPQSIGDLSAVVTGLLLGLNCHAGTPIWQCVLGSVFAVVVVKCFFGGLGGNFANPAITGRVFLLISFSGTVGGGAVTRFMRDAGADLVTSATPLTVLNGAGTTEELLGAMPSYLDLFLGNRSGAIGEVCILALLIGFLYLIVRRVIHWETPLIYIGTVFLLSLAIRGSVAVALCEILSGGLVLGAVFMATDYVTTPITRTGKMLFALGCGIITVLIRFFGIYPEGVSFSILFMNILSPYLEKWTARTPLGAGKAPAAKGGEAK